jgi:hypothetical protein
MSKIQIPLDPPFSKGEVFLLPLAVFLLPRVGKGGRNYEAFAWH